jgi:mRNA interferase RelE/StbE
MDQHYRIVLRRSVETDLKRLMPSDFRRVTKVISSLSQQPRPPGCKKLTGGEGWRIRCGVFRIIYDVDDVALEVDVRSVVHRKDAYR